MFLTHKIELRPTPKQAEFLKRTCGVKRFVWNACLAEWTSAYKLGFKPDEDYIRFFLKTLRDRNKWINEVPSRAYYSTIRDLANTFKKFFKGVCKYPRFKKKSGRQSFTLDSETTYKVRGRNLRIPNLTRPIKMRERLRFVGERRKCTISSTGGRWFVSILVDVAANPYLDKVPNENQVGIDLGIKEMAVLSDGTVYQANQPLKKQLKKLANLQRGLAKKVKGSNRYERLKRRISKTHYLVACKRSAVINNFTDQVTRKFKQITIEDLNCSGMMKNHKLARAISDVSFFEIRRQLTYKAELRGGVVIVADRFFPSSKLCSNCGCIKTDLTLKDRIYKCDCGLEIDRDENAAINLSNYIVQE